jgi:hypothetical protein
VLPFRVAGANRWPSILPIGLCLSLAAAWTDAAGAQQGTIVRGSVISAATGQPIDRAGVFVVGQDAAAGTSTSAAGFFVLQPQAFPARVVAIRLGFAPETLLVGGSGMSDQLVFRLRPAAMTLSPSVIRGDRALSAASSVIIRELDIALRPRESSQELLRLAPGLVIAQHAGGGKAEQLYLRGFDADHGTDVAISVDGIPVNMVTHAHGQGYADLHWLMPEVVAAADVRKGPYDARDGDFATAGAVAFRTKDRLDGSATLEARAGSFRTRHLVGLVPLGGDASDAGGYLAGSTHSTDGPFVQPQGYRRTNLFGKWTAPAGRQTELVVMGSGFDSRWNASGQLPDRAIRGGQVRRFGAIDSTEGGSTSRYDLSAALRSDGAGRATWEARAFVTRYRFDLFSNFTFYLSDSVNGDGIEQRDSRTMYGTFGVYGRPATVLGRTGRWLVGAGLRGDAGDVELAHQRARTSLESRVAARNDQHHIYEWARYEVDLTSRVRADVGVRGDLFRFSIRDDLTATASGAGAAARWQGIASPKLNLAFDLAPATTIFANAGTGFHSNDGRDVTVARRGERVLPRATSAEAGGRHTWTGGTFAAAAWWLDLESETVYVGDEGTTEASGRTRRVGLDVEARQRVLPWLWLDGDLNLARGRFLDEPRDANRIPLAPTVTGTGGLTVRDAGPVSGGVRVRHIGSRAAIEDNSVRAIGSTVWELFAAVDAKRARLFLAIDNLLDTTWNEAQFATTSRLLGEVGSITELHFTPGAPRSVQAGVQYRF